MKTVCLTDHKSERVLVYRVYNSCIHSPVEAFEALASHTKDRVLLEVGQPSFDEPYYAYLGVGKSQLFASDDLAGTDSFDQLDASLKDSEPIETPAKLPLAGSRVGFVTYDAARQGARLMPSVDLDCPHIYTATHQSAVTLDLREKTLIVSTRASTKAEGIVEIERITNTLKSYASPEENYQTSYEIADVSVDISDTEFGQMVQQAKEYLRQGDAFQIVLSRSFKVPVIEHPFTLYKRIREQCQSPYKFYIETESLTVCGASPERLVKVENNRIENMPIAGTRPKQNNASDSHTAEELMNDEKEHAEHMMLVDLARNDIGRVAKPGTVHVIELKKVYHYSHVMHLVSRVQGELNKGVSAVHALKASFPAGTLSGAPKIRAMEIIDSLERTKRGLYGGAILLIDQSHCMDSFIAIRMAVIKEGIASVRAGAGIVIDSTPQKEAEETAHKAKGILQAILHNKEAVA